MNHGKGNDGSGGHQGARSHNNTDNNNSIQNTINLNTNYLMKPAFIGDQELMTKPSVLGMQMQGFQAINQKMMSMDNESQIPLVAHSYNFAQQMIPKGQMPMQVNN